MTDPKIVVAGAGSIGCFVGGLWAEAGIPVTLLGRPRLMEPIAAQGLHLSDYAGLNLHLAPDRFAARTDADCLAQGNIIVVAVKSGATQEMADFIRTHAPADAVILSFQNGLSNIRTLRDALPGRDVRAAMVPFNVIRAEDGRFHRASSGDIVIENGSGALHTVLNVPDLPLCGSDRIEAVQWGKLLINLNNALNALSGLNLREQLLDRAWRQVMAAQMTEALSVFKAAGVAVNPPAPVPAGVLPWILRLPTPLFLRVASRMLSIDQHARSSMAYDLMQGRKTEVEELQGEILRLAETLGRSAVICRQVLDAVQRAEAEGAQFKRLGPDAFRV
ncbi:MAG: 2-dehydropantoate 2-reductase [Rhodobacteraceae bacterium]|nr:2-dehydropantoate 2-reductase [Paracoccaceae bacterium]